MKIIINPLIIVMIADHLFPHQLTEHLQRYLSGRRLSDSVLIVEITTIIIVIIIITIVDQLLSQQLNSQRTCSEI